MSTTQIPDPVSVGNKAEVVVSNRAILPVGASSEIQSLHPAYRYQNPVAFRNNVISNTDFRNRFIEDLFEAQISEDEEFRSQLEQNPELRQEYRRNTEGRVLNELYKEVSSGEEMIDAIVRRGSELAGMNFNQARVPDYINAVVNFPEHYEKFNITDGKKLTSHFSENPQLIGQLARSDDEFRNQIYRDRFNFFVDSLGKSHNRHGININDIDEVAKSFAIFENYGSEGLTQYVNYFQRYNPSLPLEQQDREVRMAHAFFSTSDFQGSSPSEIVNQFIGSEDSPTGRLTFQPQQMSLEIGEHVPLDLNSFSRFLVDDENIRALVSAATSRNFTDISDDNVIRQEISAPDETVEQFLSSIRNDLPSNKADRVLFDIMRLAREGQGFTQEDLFATIAVHATPQQGERGAIEYVFNPDDLPENAKVAYRALNLDFTTGGATAFRNAGDGMIAMEPERQRRLQSQTENFAGFRKVTQQRVPVFDHRGDVVGFEEGFNPRLLSFDHPNLMIGRTGQFLNDYLLTPMTNVTAKTLDFFGASATADNITSSDFYTRLREAGDFDPYEHTTSFLGGGGATLLLTDLGAYIAAAMTVGKVGAVVGGATMAAAAGRAAVAANNTRLATQAGTFMQSAVSPTRWQAQAMKTGKVLQNLRPNHGVFLRGEIGAASLEVAGGTRRSMLANPFVDTVLESVGVQADIEKRYAISDNITRAGLDLVGSIGVGLFVDNLWAGIKYGGNIARVSRGKTARGVRFDEAIGDYSKASEAVFAPEWRRLLYDMTTGLQEMPLGSLADTQANMFLGRQIFRNPENISSLEDVAGVMNHQFADFFTTLKDDIDATIRHWDVELGGSSRYDEATIARRTDELYVEMIDKIADGAVAIFRHQDPDKRDLIQFMSQRMRDQGPTVQSLAYNSPVGPKYMMDSFEANTVASSYPNTVIREVPMPDGNVMYSVQMVDEGYWGVAMSDALMARYAQVSVDDVVERNLRRLNIDDNKTAQEITRSQEVSQKASAVVGKEVVYDNQRGYITDFDARQENVYTVRGIDGIERKAVIPDRALGITSTEESLHPVLSNEYVATMYRNARTASQQTSAGPIPPSRQLPEGDAQGYAAVKEALGEMDSSGVIDQMSVGMPPNTILGAARRVGIPETEVRRTVAEKFEANIKAAQRRMESIQKDKRIKNESTRQSRLAEQQTIIDDNTELIREFNDEITRVYGGNTRELADTAFGERFGSTVTKLSTWYRDAKVQVKKMRDKARLISGRESRAQLPSTGPFRDMYGIGQKMMNQIYESTGGRIVASIPSIRKIVMGLGSDNNLVDNIGKIAYNKGDIKPLRAADVKKHTAVVYDGDVYMARQGIRKADIESGLAKPSVWMMNETGEIFMNPYWARVNRNATINPVTGELDRFVREGHGSMGPIYRKATENDPLSSQVYLNIQRPAKKPPRGNSEAIVESNIDAVVTYDQGIKRFEIVSDLDQAVAINKVHRLDPSFGLRSRNVKSIGIC
jgi:hypothetical protein